MKRHIFLVLGTIALCALPILGTLFGAPEQPHNIVQLQQAPLTRHN
jgi:hypothetical protein